VIRRVTLPALIGIVLAGAVASAAFAALQLLPRPAATVTFGNRLAESIFSLAEVRAVERVGPRRVRTVCRRIVGDQYLLTISPHRHFVIQGTTLAPLERRWHRGQTLAVEVALSGCPSLVTALLERRVLPAFDNESTLPVNAGASGRVRVYRVALTKMLELVVDRRTLSPIAIRLAPTHLKASSVLFAGGAREARS
jgi:hypothetical protein